MLFVGYFPFFILQKYSNSQVNWKQQLPGIPSHIGESVYPGVRLVTLPKSIPYTVLNSMSNNLPNSVPNSVPVANLPNGIQVSVSKDQSVDASVGNKQQAVNRQVFNVNADASFPIKNINVNQ